MAANCIFGKLNVMRIIAREKLMTDEVVSQGSTAYTSLTGFERATGDCCVFLSSTDGIITVTQQCSFNKKDWYDPISSSGNMIGQVISAQAATTGIWISVVPVLAPYSRLKVVEANSADTTVNITVMFQEQT